MVRRSVRPARPPRCAGLLCRHLRGSRPDGRSALRYWRLALGAVPCHPLQRVCTAAHYTHPTRAACETRIHHSRGSLPASAYFWVPEWSPETTGWDQPHSPTPPAASPEPPSPPARALQKTPPASLRSAPS